VLLYNSHQPNSCFVYIYESNQVTLLTTSHETIRCTYAYINVGEKSLIFVPCVQANLLLTHIFFFSFVLFSLSGCICHRSPTLSYRSFLFLFFSVGYNQYVSKFLAGLSISIVVSNRVFYPSIDC